MARQPFEILGQQVPSGKRIFIDVPVARLPNHVPVSLPVHVCHGRHDGPTLFVSAGIHGDEVLGCEIIRRLLNAKGLSAIHGTLICVPIVNVFGFLAKSRYLPDGRDLNRVFPGSKTGSLAAELAELFMREIVARSDLGIDLHTGSSNRSNLPQLRGDFEKQETRDLAESFGAPVILQSNLREGSLRAAARACGVEVLLYEAGEALRLDELSVRVGIKGILQIMHSIGMRPHGSSARAKQKPVYARSSSWIRAPEGGLFKSHKAMGDSVIKGDILGVVADPCEGQEFQIVADFNGIIIGRTNISVVNRADALYHIARVTKPGRAEDRIGQISDEVGGDPIFDEDEIV